MKQLHHPKDSRTYVKGANFDVDKEFLTLSDGQYLDSRNMRNLSMDGTNGAMKKIGGMESLYPNINNNCVDGDNSPMDSGYICIGATSVNGNIIEFWAHSSFPDVNPPYVRINGQIVLQSGNFPITYDHPLQMDVNESCIGGEIYITDFNVEPMIFNIEDMMENSGMLPSSICTDKYFSEFNLSLYTLSLNRALNHPVFVKLDAATGGYTDILSGVGLPVGYVTYSFRYATEAGDRTSWSAPTNLIPIVSRLTNGSEPNFPHLQTHSKPADISVPSVYGAHIKLRVDNVSSYDFIELRRDFWYSENPIGNPPVVEIIAKIDVTDGELSVRDILDQGKEAEEVVSGNELVEVIASIRRAKAVRYFNQTLYLMNVEYDSRDIANTLTYNNGNEMYPCIENMDKRGHGEPHNAARHKSLMRGESFGWGMLLWDGQGGYSFVDKIPNFESYQMPNRRDVASNDTVDVSYLGIPRAATVNGTVDETHEVFDLIGATSKSDYCSYRNIYQDRGAVSAGTTKPTTASGSSEGTDLMNTLYGCPTAADEGLEDPAGSVDADNLFFRPFTPTSQSDTDNDALDYVVNYKVTKDNNGTEVEYNPKGFSPRYFSMGMALDTVSGFPEWAKAFSVVRTTRANRVEAQGLGFYSMTRAGAVGSPNTSKDGFEFWFYAPDADDNHGINNNLLDAIQSDPSAYEFQLVSPLGFFTEVYSFDDDALRDKAVDLVTWCRFYNDKAGALAEINPDENPNMGILDGVTGDRFIAYGKWRSSTEYGQQHPLGANGNFSYSIDSVTEETSGRAKYLVLRSNDQIYNWANWGDNPNNTVTAVQNWHEPVYMVNIIKKNAVVPDNNTTQYKYTGNYVKLESLIGVSEYTDNNSFELVDERWEDCIQSLSGSTGVSSYDSLLRFCWIEDAAGLKRRWWNVTDASGAQITTALIDLENTGSHDVTDASGTYTIYGVYTSTEATDNAYKEFNLVFDYFNGAYSKQYQVPPLGESIYVRYDDRIPVRVFGGDTFIGDTTCCWLDKEYDTTANPVSGDEWRLSVSFPYRRYYLNPRIFVVKRSQDAILGNIQQQEKFKFSTGTLGNEKSEVRQLVSNFIVESRICLNYAFNNENPLHSSEQWFPLKNYVMRPSRWSETEFSTNVDDTIYDDNNMHESYGLEYGSEWLLWQYGGFRFLNLTTSVPLTNLDYTQNDNTRAYTSTPKLGFDEETYYCTRVAWSVRRPTNIQDSATVRTFPSSNVYDISDDSGEIKFAYSAISGKGNNLYAFTQGGICLLLVDKRIIHEINANELATVGSDVGGVLNELWLTRDVGMSGETWRSAAEHDNVIWFVNHKSAYMMAGNEVSDIGRTGYHSKLYPYFLMDMPQDYTRKLTAVFDEHHSEYWVNFGGFTIPEGLIDAPTLVFGNTQGMWIGGFDYDFDQYVSIDNFTYGIKNSGTFLLDEGNQIDGQDIVSELVNASVGDIAYEQKTPIDNRYMDKEFLRIRVNSSHEPSSVDFYNSFDQYVAGSVQANIDNVANPLAMKDYYGYEGYIPRKTAAPRNRMQGRLLIYNIINIFDEGFKITTTDIQYKKLK
jgi:hypothetical protein